MSGARTQKDQVIDALILVFERSQLASVVGSDALRSVLAVEYHDMVSDGVFDMALLWELLEEQPGFDAELAMPPLCLFKSWEDRLDLTVELPPRMAELSDKDRALFASECRVSPGEMSELFGGGTAGTPQSGAAARESQRQAVAEREAGGGTAVAGPRQRPAWMGYLATVVAIGTFAFCSMTLYGHCAGPRWGSVSQLDLSKTLPVANVGRLGKTLRGDVDLAAWNRLEPAAQRDKLRLALLEAESRGVTTIALVANGAVVATVQRTTTNELDVWLKDER